MRKQLLSITALLGVAAGAWAQALMSPTDMIALEDAAAPAARSQAAGQGESAGSIDLLVTLADGYTPDDVTGDGIRLVRTIGSVHILRVEAAALAAVTANPAVATISVSREMSVTNNVARELANIDAVHAGTDLAKAFTGKNVLVGIIDGGIDYNHVNFKDAAGNTRIRKIWQYNNYTDVTIASTPEEIAALTCDKTSGTHGTHTLGTAAGSYASTSRGDFRGMAPDANLLICSGSANTSSNILKSVADMTEEARALGMPLVINISLGNTNGPHDGSDAFCRAMDDLALDVPVVISAGNNGYDDIVVKKTFTATDTQVRTALIRAGKNLAGLVEIYSEDSTPFTVDLDLIDSSTKKVIASIKNSDLSTETKTLVASTRNGLNTYLTVNSSTIKYAAGLDPDNNRYMVTYNVNFGTMKKTTLVPVITITEGTPGKRVDVYCTPSNYNMSLGKVSSLGDFDTPTADGTINSLCTGRNTIAVGAFTSRDQSSGWASTKGQMAAFSSWGTLIDGRELPHVSAAGCWLVSSMSRYNTDGSATYDSATVDGETYPWTTMAGTSMSAPVVTGTVATWLQANPSLTPAEVRDIAMATASKPATFDGSVKWGAGLIDGYAGVKKALESASIDDVMADGNDPLLISEIAPNVYEVFVAGQDRLTLTVYTLAGQAAATARAEGNTAVIDLSGLAKGVYVISANGTAASLSRKCYVK